MTILTKNKKLERQNFRMHNVYVKFHIIKFFENNNIKSRLTEIRIPVVVILASRIIKTKFFVIFIISGDIAKGIPIPRDTAYTQKQLVRLLMVLIEI